MTGHTNDLVTQLIHTHVAAELRSYQGNLSFATHIVQNEWLPAEDAPGIQQHLATLRQHLGEAGHPENDGFLLRLGLAAPGMQRGIVPPLIVLDENRGGFSARRQREAEGQIIRLREALSIGRHFVPDLSSDTHEAVVELADLSQRQSVPEDIDWLGWFDELSPDEAEQLAERAVECLGSDEKSVCQIGTDILQHLVCFRRPPLSEACCCALVERGVFWPPCLYRDSGDAVAGQLIPLIEETDVLNHLLLSLAWTRSSAAERAFREWTDQPPSWASKLYVPPKEYLLNASWCLGDDGLRRELVSSICFRLTPAEEGATQSVRCRTSIGEPCPSCGGPASWLFDFSQVDAEYLSGEFADAPRKILCCLHCSCYAPVFTTYRGDGTGEWLSGNEPSEVNYTGDREACVRQLDESPSPPFACAEAFGLNDASTLGGVPMWLQDAEFPRCIECSRLMTFLAQHDNSPQREEGIYYAFFCSRCRVAAVSYQQT